MALSSEYFTAQLCLFTLLFDACVSASCGSRKLRLVARSCRLFVEDEVVDFPVASEVSEGHSSSVLWCFFEAKFELGFV